MVSEIRTIIEEEEDKNYKISSHPTIFHEILSSDLPLSEKKLDRLWQEGQTIVGAGTETTAWTMSVIVYHVLSNPAIKKRLLQELNNVMKDGNVPCIQLEKIPYFAAIVSEGLRLSYGVTTRLQRVSPDQVLPYKNWQIPPGVRFSPSASNTSTNTSQTPVGMTTVLQHHDPSIFPDPTTFNPERWLENPHLSRYLVSFCKGSRGCLGINLAYAEIYMCLASIFVAFPEMRLWETTVEDVVIQADNYMPKASGRGVTVMLD